MVWTIAQLSICGITVSAEHTKSRWIAITFEPQVRSRSSTPLVTLTMPQLSAMFGSAIVTVVDTQEFKSSFSATRTITPAVSFERCAFESRVISLSPCSKFWRTHGTECPVFSVTLPPAIDTHC
jgi:hypothetical protein